MKQLEVITGPMFSGKSEELIRRINTAIYGEKKVLIIKPKADTRYAFGKVVARKKNSVSSAFEPHEEVEAHEIGTEEEARVLVSALSPEFIAIDEAQFFEDWLVQFVWDLMHGPEKPEDSALHVVVAGLDMNFRGEPFGALPRIMAIADKITKLKAVCFACKGKFGPGILSKKIGGGREEVEVGDSELYEARCRMCFNV